MIYEEIVNKRENGKRNIKQYHWGPYNRPNHHQCPSAAAALVVILWLRWGLRARLKCLLPPWYREKWLQSVIFWCKILLVEDYDWPFKNKTYTIMYNNPIVW